ncbi:hypothetical protein GCM10027051_02010 [Niabella terrae]
MIAPGHFLKSNSQDPSDYFREALVYITESGQDGCIGYIFNRSFPRNFNELQEFSDSPPFPLFEGGPMEQEKLFFIHRRPDLIEEGRFIGNETWLNGDFKAVVAYLNIGMLDQTDMKFFIGYCGWDSGQLEAEIQSGEWTVIDDPGLFEVG